MKRRGSLMLLNALIIFVLLFTSGCTSGGSSSAARAYKSIVLKYWSVWDDEDSLSELIAGYTLFHPNVTVEYRKFRYEEYERELLEALAEDRGPDIFSVHNTWMKRYQSKLLPLPPKTVVPVKMIKGSVKKEEVVEFITKPAITPLLLKKKYLDIVNQDVIMPYNVGEEDTPEYVDKIWGLPLSMDTLVMYYNKNLLSNAGIVEPAKTWAEFQEQVKKMTKLDASSGDIVVSGAAIGTADNVSRSFDILSLLMMQNMAPMIDDSGAVAFDKRPEELSDLPVAPGIGALEYYTQFASPLYEGYSWNNKMPNSLDAFIKGQVGYFFGYSYQKSTIVAKAPKLKFDIAPVPQVGPEQKVNYANYWVQSVSNKTKEKDFAWDFLQFIADEPNVTAYLQKNKRPTALKSTKVINEQLADEDLSVFADQLLTAKSWYKGYNSSAAEESFAGMIEAVLDGSLTSAKAVKQAVEQINQSIDRKPGL